MEDDNVLMDHSVMIATELQRAGRPFEYQLYAGERHGIDTPRTKAHLWRTTVAFFDRYLKDGK